MKDPNVEEIARNKAKAAARLKRSLSCLVPLQPRGTKRPFFCIHPLAGVVFPYYELAFALGKEQPFYGLQSVGISKKEPPLSTIEEMAARYIKAIQVVQPEGPYALGGWSLGALIAFEMAQQLQQAGQSVGLLVSLDGPACSPSRMINTWETARFTLTTVIPNIWPYVFDFLNLQERQELENNERNKLGKSLTANRETEIAQAIAQKAERGSFRQAAVRRLLPVMWANTKAYVNYKPRVYPGEMTLIRSRRPSRNVNRYPTLGWQDIVQKEIDILDIPGHHLNILRQPQVETLAQTLKSCLDRI